VRQALDLRRKPIVAHDVTRDRAGLAQLVAGNRGAREGYVPHDAPTHAALAAEKIRRNGDSSGATDEREAWKIGERFFDVPKRCPSQTDGQEPFAGQLTPLGPSDASTMRLFFRGRPRR